jgi:hypothetical protein
MRTLAALAPETRRIWWATLAVGLVVAVVVVALLQLLLNAVRRIERNVVGLWQTATMVARNTATTWLLGRTVEVLEEVEAEALRHDALLSRAAGAPVPGASPRPGAAEAPPDGTGPAPGGADG